MYTSTGSSTHEVDFKITILKLFSDGSGMCNAMLLLIMLYMC